MDRRLADEFRAGLGKDHHRIGRALGVFFHDGAEAFLHMGLQRIADIDLFSTDLVAHVSSRQDWRHGRFGSGRRRAAAPVHGVVKNPGPPPQSCPVAGVWGAGR
jgi:hypothetical protein